MLITAQTPAVEHNPAVAAGSLLVHQLSDFKGPPRIVIPVGTDLGEYQSLVFHCEAYFKLWDSSSLH